MDKKLGTFLAVGAAVCFGLSSITGKFTYLSGGNATTIIFYRNLISIPLLYIVLRMKKTDMRITKHDFKGFMLMGLLCGFATAVLIYTAYTFISAGLTTCVHFCYPVILALIYVFVFHERFSRTKIIALTMSIAGIWFFLDGDTEMNVPGIVAALLSGVAYASYVVVLDKWKLSPGMNGFKISFYCCITSNIWLLIYGLYKQYDFTKCDRPGWIWIFLTALLITCIGNAMIPEAIKRVGPTVTGIFGILEPVVSVILSTIIFKDAFGFKSIIGAVLVLTATVLLTLEKDKRLREA